LEAYQKQLEEEQREEEDKLMKNFQEERQEVEDEMQREMDKEWEVHLGELTKKFESSTRGKKLKSEDQKVAIYIAPLIHAINYSYHAKPDLVQKGPAKCICVQKLM
jgi:hypothetical protein